MFKPTFNQVARYWVVRGGITVVNNTANNAVFINEAKVFSETNLHSVWPSAAWEIILGVSLHLAMERELLTTLTERTPVQEENGNLKFDYVVTQIHKVVPCFYICRRITLKTVKVIW